MKNISNQNFVVENYLSELANLQAQILQQQDQTYQAIEQRLSHTEAQVRQLATELERSRIQEARLQQELQTQKDAWQEALAKIEKISSCIEKEKKQAQTTVPNILNQRKPSRVPICVERDEYSKFTWNSREGDFVKKDQIIAFTDVGLGWWAESRILPVHSPATGVLVEVKQVQNGLFPHKKTVVGYIQPT